MTETATKATDTNETDLVEVKPTYSRNPWKDQFNQPTIEILRDGMKGKEGLKEDYPQMFDALRERMSTFADPGEELVWHGDCWHWVLEYHRSEFGDEPLAIIIPGPDDLQFAMLMEDDFIATLNFRRMKRMVRDGIDLCRIPYDTRWGVWSLIPGTMMDDLFGLLKAKIRFANKKNKKKPSTPSPVKG